MLGSLIFVIAAAGLGPLSQPLQLDEPVPPVDAAAAAAAQAAAEPTATSPEVLGFLGDVQGRIYDPRNDGLASLSFTLPIEDPMMGRTANTRVSWSAGKEPVVEVEMLDFELPAAVAQMGMTLEQLRERLAPQADAAGRDFLSRMLGEVMADVTRGRVGSMNGVEEGQVVVRFGPSGMPMDPVKEHLLYVDDDDVLRKLVVVVSSQMGDQQIENVLDWEPAKDGDQLLAKTMTVSMDTPMGKMDFQKVDFGYQNVGDMVLLTKLTTQTTMPGMPMPEVTQTLSDLLVNGQPVATPSTPVRAGTSSSSAADSAAPADQGHP